MRGGKGTRMKDAATHAGPSRLARAERGRP
jgi:hypothetical protein